MEAQFDRSRSDALAVLSVIWAAGLLATLCGILALLAVQSYDPALSCGELAEKAGYADGLPQNLDAWDDYELICNGHYWRP